MANMTNFDQNNFNQQYCDPFAKPVDPFAKPVDPFAKPVDPFAKPVDPFAKPEDSDEDCDEDSDEDSDEDNPFNKSTDDDPFAQSSKDSFPESIVVFGVRKNARRADTYIARWPIDKGELKEHLKNLKKNICNCSGSIKTVQFEGRDELALHLQGDQIKKVAVYIKNTGASNLLVKPII
jgi:translation initiation factor 1 (eIF-1/SUI1)